MVEQSVEPSNLLRSVSIESSRKRFACPTVDGQLFTDDDAAHPIEAVVADSDVGSTSMPRPSAGAGV